MRSAIGAVLMAALGAQVASGQVGQPVRPGQPLGQRPQMTAPAANTAPAYVPPAAQGAPRPGYTGQPAYPQSQTVPQARPLPTPQQAAPPQNAPGAPFVLTPADEAQLDRMLQYWEQSSAKVKTFSCKFRRWHYDPEFRPPKPGEPDQPVSTDLGELKYAKPDCGALKIEGDRPEHWICDGKSIFQYEYDKKQLTERPLPPDMQGEAVRNGPIPFLFGAKADEIKRRYFVRMVTPADVKDQVWLEAFPRYQQDAANFFRVELILSAREMQPLGIQIYQPNNRTRDAYSFYDIVVNDPLGFLKLNPFSPSTPLGWKKVTESAQATARSESLPPASARQLPPGSLR